MMILYLHVHVSFSIIITFSPVVQKSFFSFAGVVCYRIKRFSDFIFILFVKYTSPLVYVNPPQSAIELSMLINPSVGRGL